MARVRSRLRSLAGGKMAARCMTALTPCTACVTGHLRDVSLHNLDARLTLQPGKIAHRQVKDTHGMPISPAAGHKTAAHTARSPVMRIGPLM